MSSMNWDHLRKRGKNLLSAAWFNLVPELLAFDSLCSIAACTICSYYVYKLGYLLGAHSSTPAMASIFSDMRVLQGSFYPREVRLYAWILLCMSVGTLVWSVWLGLRTLEHEPIKLDSNSAVSPKLPFTNPPKSTPLKYTPVTGSFVSLSPRQPPSAIRAACISRIKKFVVLFCFCLAFLRRQKVTSTLVYHPVNSPFLLKQQVEASTLDVNLADEVEEYSQAADMDDLIMPVQHNTTVVPSIIHFVFGMDETFGGKPFGFAHYLSMYSAIAENHPDTVMFWYLHLPSTNEHPNWWFDRIVADAEKLGANVELKKARDFDNIFGRAITEFAHKADIIRLEALLEYGGIYVDLDVYTIRSMEPLRHYDTVLGLEGGVPSLKVQGLCNAVIVSAPQAPFLRKWYETYRTFNRRNWAAHSVEKPLQLALRYPDELLVLDPYALFYPAWNEQGLRIVHSKTAESLSEGWDFHDSQQFTYHAWSKFAHKKWLSKLTPDKVFTVETSFNILMRRWTTEDLRQDWRTAIKKGLVE